MPDFKAVSISKTTSPTGQTAIVVQRSYITGIEYELIITDNPEGLELAKQNLVKLEGKHPGDVETRNRIAISLIRLRVFQILGGKGSGPGPILASVITKAYDRLERTAFEAQQQAYINKAEEGESFEAQMKSLVTEYEATVTVFQQGRATLGPQWLSGPQLQQLLIDNPDLVVKLKHLLEADLPPMWLRDP
jgi:hypothetical protein